ncbi:MAG: hypothetical protein M1835_000660 [Candelina submexicana]|nr:MAG: hypothetical protein M1835_000660 [Candelina submexicana]
MSTDTGKNELTQHTSEKDSEPDNIEPVGMGTKPSLGSRVKAHYKKFWWLHLLILIAVTLIIVLPLVYVAYPKIAQDGVNDSRLEIQSMSLTNPTTDSFDLELKTVVRSDNRYHPHLDAFNASLYLNNADGKPFSYIQIPAVHATEEALSTSNQTVKIADLSSQFADYASVVLAREQYNLIVKGRTDLHEMRFPTTTVDYNKQVTLRGLNGLKGFNVTSFQILVKPEPDGANMLGKVYIPNPSIMTLEMGNVTLSLSTNSLPIGTSLLPNLILKPGNNTLDMRSTVNQSLVLSSLKLFKDGMVPVDIVGNSSIYNGQHLPYYEKALRANKQSITLDVGGALKAAGLAGLAGL